MTSSSQAPAPDISVVVPVYNEQEVLPELKKRLLEMLHNTGRSWEVVFVDDGSADATPRLLEEFHTEEPRIKYLALSRNFGHQTALTAGLDHAAGKAVIAMDGDLQDPPEVIPSFIAKWEEGYQVVYGVRRSRGDAPGKKILAALYYRLLQALSKNEIPMDSGDFSLMDRRVVQQLRKIPERNRFIRGLRSWVGFRQTGVAFERDRRYAGTAKYSFLKSLRLGIDGIVSFSEAPLKFSIVVGFLISFLSICYSLYIIIAKLLGFGSGVVLGWASLVVSITFMNGVVLMVIGFLGEYLLRIYDEVKGRPQYIIGSQKGFDPGED